MMTDHQALAFLFRCTSDGVVIADERGIIVQINPAAASLLGVTVEEVTGKSATVAFIQNPALLNLFNRPSDQTLDVRLPRRRLAAGIATTLSDSSRIVILQDISEKRDMESRREALVTTIAHDLRNPISALSGFADLVEKFGELNPQQQKFITRIKQTASKLYDVADTLVDLAWIEAGMPLDHRPIHVGVLIGRVVSQLASFAQDKQVAIATSVQDPLPTVMGDQSRIQTAIHNVLHNAILYSHPEQTVAIHAWGDTREIYCSIADRGIGIADDELDLIFDRLYRSRDDRVRDLPGGGLGLTLARTVIQRHGGDLWASSNLNVGSAFTFVLPAVNEQADV